MKKESEAMEFTGERFVPEVHGNIELEHLHRYLQACEIAAGKAVLDIASGEGYGSAMLASRADKVMGVDISVEAVEHARKRYHKENLQYTVGSCTDIPLPDASVDMVVSFETIEHHDQHEKMMQEIKRVLRPTGVLLISSPDKYHYSVERDYSNQFHVKELDHREFKELLADHFKNVAYFGQRVIHGSGIFAESLATSSLTYWKENEIVREAPGMAKPMYRIALASNAELPRLATGLLEQPINDSEIIRSWVRVVAERDGQIASLNQALATRDGQIASLNQTVTMRDGQIASLDQTAAERDAQIVNLNQALTERDGRIAGINQAVAERDKQLATQRDEVQQLQRAVSARDAIVTKRDGQIASLNKSVADLTEEAVRRGEWALRLDAELKESQSNLTAILRSGSWRITLPLRVARQQSERCVDAALRLSKRTYQALPLSAQTKALHRNWIARHAPRLLSDNGTHPVAFDESPGKARVKIAAVTMVYNEALILPYFLRHYRYLDEIHVLYETDTTDESLEILRRAPNVVIEKCHIEGGLDDIAKIDLINKTLQKIKADWVYVVDPDEFVFPPNESPHDFLKRQSRDVVRAGMFQVYRHRNDKDLDPSLAPVPQRLHGDSDLLSTERQAIRASNSVYVKPNIVRPSKGIRFYPGHHDIEGDPQTSPELYVGVHWQMADPAIAIARRMARKARISERNKAHQMGWQNFDVSVDKIKEECERHLDDPIIDVLRSFSEVNAQSLPSGARTSRASVATARVFDPLEHPICLSSPRRTVPFLSWRQHVPFAMLLVDVLKPKTLVELGVHHGDSYCAFCQAVAELRLGTSCYGVDTWKGDPHASFYEADVLADLAAHHDPLYGGFSRLMQKTFDEALQHFPDGSIDILHIDGYHTYEAVKHDFETWLPKVSPKGVILFHDISEKRQDFGVWRVWDEVKARHPHFEFPHCHGLGLIAVGERPPEELRWLLEADDEKAAAIRNFFFCLGDRLTDKLTLSAKQGAATIGGSELEALRAAGTELEAIRSSTTWRVARKFHSVFDAVLPLGTKRRAYARQALTPLNRPLAKLK